MSDRDAQANGTGRPVPGERAMLRHILLQYAVGAVLLLLVALLWYASSVLLVIFSGILLAVLLSSATNMLVRWLHLPRGIALAAVLLLAVIVLVAGGWLLTPRITEQATQLMTSLSDAVERVRGYLHGLLPEAVVQSLPGMESGSSGLRMLMERAGNVFVGVFGVLANLVIIIFLGIYLAAQPRVYVNLLVVLFPKHRHQRLHEVLDQTGDTLGRWLLGKLLTMLIVGVFTAVGLLMLGVPLALVLGLVAGLLDFIPYLGPILSAVPAILIGFSESPTMALYVLALFVGIQIVESYLLQPLIALKMVSLPPAVTISVQVLMAIPFGLLGVALATPLAAAIAVLVSMLYVQDVLEEPVKPPGVK